MSSSIDLESGAAVSGVEFYVRNVMSTPAGETLVVGVANNGRALSVGARFQTKYEVSRDDAMQCAANPTRRRSFVVDLVVERIDVIRSVAVVQGEVRQVPHGTTAALSLSGRGLEHVKQGCFLRTKES